MTSIVYQDRSSGSMYLYKPKYPAQRSMFEQKRTERIIAALEELRHVANINIFTDCHYFLSFLAQELLRCEISRIQGNS